MKARGVSTVLLAWLAFISACAGSSSAGPVARGTSVPRFLVAVGTTTVSNPAIPIESEQAARFSVIDAGTGRVERTFTLATGNFRVSTGSTVLTPDGRTAYFFAWNSTGGGSNERSEVIPVDLANGTATHPISLHTEPSNMVLAGGLLFVAETGSAPPPGSPEELLRAMYRKGNSVLVLSTSTDSIVRTIDVCDYPRNLAASPDGRTVWVTCGAGGEPSSVRPIDARSLALGTPIASPAGQYASNVQFIQGSHIAIMKSSTSDSVNQYETSTRYFISLLNTKAGSLGATVSIPAGDLLGELVPGPSRSCSECILGITENEPVFSGTNPGSIISSVVGIDLRSGTLTDIPGVPRIALPATEGSVPPVLLSLPNRVVLVSSDPSLHALSEWTVSPTGTSASAGTARVLLTVPSSDTGILGSTGYFFYSSLTSTVRPFYFDSGKPGKPFHLDFQPDFVSSP